MNNNTKINLFFDMDGTLNEWQDVNNLEECYEQNFFLSRKPINSMINLVKSLISNNNYEVYILSSYIHDSQFAFNEKKEWLKIYLPELNDENIILTPYGFSKAEYVRNLSNNDILIDDYSKNLHDWLSKGGKCIKCFNGINSVHKSWINNEIDIDSKYLELDFNNVVYGCFDNDEIGLIKDAFNDLNNSEYDTALLEKNFKNNDVQLALYHLTKEGYNGYEELLDILEKYSDFAYELEDDVELKL